MKKLVGICALSAFAAAALFAQTASLSGTVSDPTGAVIPKATVTVTNTQTGAKRSDVSDAQGRYTISQLHELHRQNRNGGDRPLENAILLVSEVAAGVGDVGITPLGGNQPRVLLHSTALNDLIQRTWFHRSPRWADALVLAFILPLHRSAHGATSATPAANTRCTRKKLASATHPNRHP